MDSINRNQPEKNREDLVASGAVKEIKAIVEKAKSCFFCTDNGVGESAGIRPMTVQKMEDDGTMWFLSPSDSHKNLELKDSSVVKLFFQGSSHSDFVFLEGNASVSSDRARIEELWEPVLKTWFTEGKDDPRISVIRFSPKKGYYWDTKHGELVAGAKMMAGALIGKTLDDSIEGTLAV